MQKFYRAGKLARLFFSTILLASVAAGPILQAQPTLVKDIYPGPSSSGISTPVAVNGILYFAANNGVNGAELWKSDGTAAGTVLVKDIYPGTESANPANLITVNGALYFTATDGTGGVELWKSNGTAAGTVMVKDINSGAGNANPAELTNVNGTLYFAADNGVNGAELWKSDGTAAGTVLVKDLTGGSGSTDPSKLVNVNGTLFFVGQYGFGLYKSDGTEAGTVLVSSIPVNSPAALNGMLYFIDYNRSTLWKSDGTEAGTVAVKRFKTNSTDNPYDNFYFLKNVNGALYFVFSELPSNTSANFYLWKSDGTVAGTRVVASLGSGIRSSGLGSSAFMGDAFYYSITTGTPSAAFLQQELMKASLSTGTVGMVKDIFPGSVSGRFNSSAPANLTVVNNTLYFSADDNGSNRELWKSDGTEAGTLMAGDTHPAGNSSPAWLTGVGNVLFFSADNGTSGAELYKYDPSAVTASTTFRLNSGGSAYAAAGGRNFSADQYATGGGTLSLYRNEAIAHTEDDALYRTERWGDFSYQLPVTNGSYQVTLHFAEIYFGNLTIGGVGSRKFNVDVEGSRKLSEFDIIAEAGGALKAIRKVYTVTVTDGILTIDLIRGSADNPKISAIEVVPAPTAATVQVNTGGGAYTAVSGKTFAADQYFTGGNAAETTGEVANTEDDALYRSERWGVFNYNLPVSNGNYTVILHFNEFYFGATYQGQPISGGVGSRKFNVDIEGSRKLTEYDIFAKAGGAMKAVQESFTVHVGDGMLNINFGQGSANFPKISAIEVVPAASAARVGAETVASIASAYPNPAEDQLTVTLDQNANTVRSTAVLDGSGRIHLSNTHQITGEKQLEIRVGTLTSGLYLLKVNTPQGVQVLKFVRR